MDQYKESHDARKREGALVSRSFPKSVILVGHSMGGFVARTTLVHPQLRKSVVETVLTLSSPHQWVFCCTPLPICNSSSVFFCWGEGLIGNLQCHMHRLLPDHLQFHDVPRDGATWGTSLGSSLVSWCLSLGRSPSNPFQLILRFLGVSNFTMYLKTLLVCW